MKPASANPRSPMIFAAHPEDYDVAANIDENRDVESETPDD